MTRPKSNPPTRPTVLEVWLNHVRAGTITNLPNDRNIFLFDEAYVADPSRPTLSLSFLDAERNIVPASRQVTARVAPFFSNLLPEGHLREYLAERGGINPVREFFLLWLLGADLPGAVRIQDAEGHPLPPSHAPATGTKPSNGEVLRFSLAGVQLKFSAVGHPNKQLAIPVEGRGGHWIVKLPSTRYPLVPENEFSMMTLAAKAGIDAAEVALAPTGAIENLPGRLADDQSNSLIVKRFDRTPEGARIHIEDFNQVYAQYPQAKYDNYSYGNMAGDIWRVLSSRDLAEFVRRLVFNAGIGNADMHLKNWSLIYPDGKTPRLAPAYDFVSTIRYLPDNRMALSIAGEKDPRLLDTDLLQRFAARAQLPAAPVIETALEAAEKLVLAWREINADLPMDAETRKRIGEQMKSVPLIRQFLKPNASPLSTRSQILRRRGRPPRTPRIAE